MGALRVLNYEKCNIDRSHYLFDNQALVSLIVPLIIEQLLTVLVGMADSIMVANVGEAWRCRTEVSFSRPDYGTSD